MRAPSIRRLPSRVRVMVTRMRSSLVAGLGFGLATLAAACSGGTATSDATSFATSDAVDHVPGAPGLGAHAIAFQRLHAGQTTLSTPALATAASGSTLVVSVGRGELAAHVAPTDTPGNTYQQLGAAHAYDRWPSSGTAVYAVTGAAGGSGHAIRAATPADDEVTMAAVEVREGAVVADHAWVERLAGTPLRSGSVTTTGPATLVAFWWGDADVTGDKTAVANNGFAVIDAVLSEGALVQAAVAVKNVAAAGTYDVTWTATPTQGAQLWLIAIQ